MTLRSISDRSFPVVILFGFLTFSSAQKYLTGELTGTYSEGEYVVTGNVNVVPGATLTFAPGCALKFENYTGIVVRGMLVCKGTAAKPIVFTSYRDTRTAKSAAESFDWNGIKVTPETAYISIRSVNPSF